MKDICDMISSRRYGKTSCDEFVGRFDEIGKTREIEKNYASLIADIRVDCQLDRYTIEENNQGQPIMKFLDSNCDAEGAYEHYQITKEGDYNVIRLDDAVPNNNNE